jgi:predicted RNA binding protein YcfA (HicA-like mRNA interferase family)
MTKTPRDLTGRRLCDAMKRLGYQRIRSAGDHWIMETVQNGTHRISVQQHKPLKTGTAADLLNEIRTHFKLSLDELLKKLRL